MRSASSTSTRRAARVTSRRPSRAKAVTVVDTPGYLNDKLGGCVEVADIAIVPVEPSQRGLRAMKRTIQLITGVNPELEIGLIVNRYSDKRIIDRSFTDFLTADDLPILGCVPTAEAFKRGASFNRPVSEVQPGGPRRTRSRDSGQGGGDAVMARTKKADSAINSFFSLTPPRRWSSARRRSSRRS